MSKQSSTAELHGLSDSDLVDLARSGSESAYGELWNRHAGAAKRLAYSTTKTFDADDIVAEAFTRIYGAIRNGGGPTNGFRPYLFTSVRNVAAGWGRNHKEDASEELEPQRSSPSSEEEALDRLDRSLSAEAFRSLPSRWQEALWYSEIEQMKPRYVAQVLGMSSSATRVLIFRAREGLRQAWVQGHLKRLDEDSPHRWVIERLGAYALGSTSARDTKKIEDHLASCTTCTVVASEADNLGGWLSFAVLPLIVGLKGSALYANEVRIGTTTSPSGPMPKAVTHASPSKVPPSPTPPPHTLPVAPASSMLGVGALIAIKAALTNATKATLVKSAIGVVVVSGVAVGGGAMLGVFSTTEHPQTTISLPTTTAEGASTTQAAQPFTARLSTESTLFLPQLAGTGMPGSIVTISNADATLTTIPVDQNGFWSTGQLTVEQQSGTLTAQVESTPGQVSSIDVDFSLDLPTVTSQLSADGRTRSVIVAGTPGAPIDVLTINNLNDSLAATNLDASGTWSTTFTVDPTVEAQAIVARYGAGDRYGLLATS